MIRDQIVHGSCVALAGGAVLVLGPSGSGKSAFALALMAVGARLVADDRTLLRVQDGALIADAPMTLRGLIEARGVGLLRADPAGPTPLRLVVDLGQTETDRLPPERIITLCGVALPLVLGPYSPHLCHAARQMLLSGRAY